MYVEKSFPFWLPGDSANVSTDRINLRSIRVNIKIHNVWFILPALSGFFPPIEVFLKIQICPVKLGGGGKKTILSITLLEQILENHLFRKLIFLFLPLNIYTAVPDESSVILNIEEILLIVQADLHREC